jgi:hypothetical protein
MVGVCQDVACLGCRCGQLDADRLRVWIEDVVSLVCLDLGF